MGEADSSRLERYLRAPKWWGPQRRGAPRGCSPQGSAPLRKRGYLQPSEPGAAPGQWVCGAMLSGSRGTAACQHHVGSGSAAAASQSDGGDSYGTALRFSSCSENRPGSALQRELPPEGDGGGRGEAASAGWCAVQAGGKQIKGSASAPRRASSRPVSTLSLALMVSFFRRGKEQTQ